MVGAPGLANTVTGVTPTTRQELPMTDMISETGNETEQRRLATIETITDLAAIPDADAIVRARVRGWDVVVKLDEFEVGDRCVYIEVDAMVDVTDERFAFLEPRGVRTDATGRSGHVLKTARLRGQYSQGLALPLALFPELDADGTSPGRDVTEALGIVKWDPPVPANLAGQVRGMRPSWIPKTDEDRIQNVPEILTARHLDWVATEKIDGSSTSFYIDGQDKGVCSRNLDLLETDGNTLWRLARELNVHDRLATSNLGARVVVQGETFGEGVQGNPLKIAGQRFCAFTVIADGKIIPRSDWPEWVKALSVPTHDLAFPDTVEDALAQVERITSNVTSGRPAEGIVWRAADQDRVDLADGRSVRASFKAISNRYLMKHDR